MIDGPVVVLGSALVDRTYRLYALPLPGERALAREVGRDLGGKGANQAAAARRLGAPVVFVGCVGDDEDGRETEEELTRTGVQVRATRVAGIPTGHAAVFVDDSGETQVAVEAGANAHLPLAAVEESRDVLARAGVFVTQLEVPLDVVRAALLVPAPEDRVTLLNAAPLHGGAPELFSSFDVVVVNRSEAEQLAGVGVGSLDDALAALRALRDLGAADPVVTLGAAGAVCLDRGRGVHVPAPPCEARDTMGAGDAFVGALAAFLREGQPLVDAAAGACGYAALAVTRPGARAAYADRRTFDAASGA